MSEQKLGYAVVIAQQLKEGTSISVQFNMVQGADPADWNSELDKLTGVLGRQVARASLEQQYNELKHHELTAEVIAQDIEKMNATIAKAADAAKDSTRRNPINTQQLQGNLDAQKGALEKTQRMVEEVKKIIAATEKKAA